MYNVEGQKGGAKGAMRNRGKGGKGRGGGGSRGNHNQGEDMGGGSKIGIENEISVKSIFFSWWRR